MKSCPVIAIMLAGVVGSVLSAQAAEPAAKSAPPKGVSINIGKNVVKNESGVIDENADIEGIVIINGEVNIDGVKVPRGVKKFHSPKTGKNYRIDWGKGDDVSVSEQ